MATPTLSAQFGAINNGANSNSLVSQLYAGKQQTSTPQTISQPVGGSATFPNATPYFSTPNVQASASAVKSPSQQNTASTPVASTSPNYSANQTQAASASSPGYTYVNGVLTSVGGQSTGLSTANPYIAPTSALSTPQPVTPSTPTASVTGTTAPTTPTVQPPASSLAGITNTIPLAQATNSLLAAPAANSAITAQDQAISANYGQQIANVGNLGAGTIAGDLSTGTSPIGEGNAAIASQSESNRISALSAAENAALAGPAQELTGQAQSQSALGTAGQLASPSNTNVTPPAGAVTTNTVTGQTYSNPIYEPATDAYQALSPQPNGTPGQPSTAGQASQYTIKSGDTLDNIAAANGTTEAALLAANPSITNPNNIQAGASLTIPASGTGNTAFSGGEVAGQAVAGQNVVNMKGALASAQSIHAQITSLLAANPTLNASPTSIGNQINQYLNTGVIPTGPYTQLIQDLTDYAATASAALGYGGAPTDSKTILSQSLVPTLAAGGTLDAALTNLETTIQGKIDAQTKVGQNPSAPVQTNSPNTFGQAATSGWGSITY